jgi:FtsZ-binding cell division protein ZapB
LELLYKENRDSLQRADNESPHHSSALSQENQKLRRVIEEMQTKIVEAYEK